mmetsp:Transcript_30052/g.82524  ORF Transcript_30052/g.82524 Transcript_30052/m.82524 type:complete len:211 (+) Transcript_30052:67-699(+)
MNVLDFATMLNTLLGLVAVAVVVNCTGGALAICWANFARQNDNDEAIAEIDQQHREGKHQTSRIEETLYSRKVTTGEGYDTDETLCSSDCDSAYKTDFGETDDRRVRFSNISIRSYDVVEEESLTSLDWSYQQESLVPINHFERTKSTNKSTPVRKSHTRRRIVGTPLSGPKKLRKLNNRQKRVVATTTAAATTTSAFRQFQYALMSSSR